MNSHAILNLSALLVAVVIGVPVIIVALRVVAGAAEAILSSAFIAIAIFIGVLIAVMSSPNFLSG